MTEPSIQPLTDRSKNFCNNIYVKAKKTNPEIKDADFIYFDFAVSTILAKDVVPVVLAQAVQTVADRCVDWINWSLSGVEIDQSLSERCAAILQRLYFTVSSDGKNKDIWGLEDGLELDAWPAYKEFLTREPAVYRDLPEQQLVVYLEVEPSIEA